MIIGFPHHRFISKNLQSDTVLFTQTLIFGSTFNFSVKVPKQRNIQTRVTRNNRSKIKVILCKTSRLLVMSGTGPAYGKKSQEKLGKLGFHSKKRRFFFNEKGRMRIAGAFTLAMVIEFQTS